MLKGFRRESGEMASAAKRTAVVSKHFERGEAATAVNVRQHLQKSKCRHEVLSDQNWGTPASPDNGFRRPQ